MGVETHVNIYKARSLTKAVQEPEGTEHAVPRVYRLMYDDVCAHLPSLR